MWGGKGPRTPESCTMVELTGVAIIGASFAGLKVEIAWTPPVDRRVSLANLLKVATVHNATAMLIGRRPPRSFTLTKLGLWFGGFG